MRDRVAFATGDDERRVDSRRSKSDVEGDVEPGAIVTQARAFAELSINATRK